MSTLAQVALCTADFPRTIRLFVEVLGFGQAGGRARWGTYPAQVQELPTGDDTYAMMWWLVGDQEFVQVEIFQHTSPAQRPKRAGWRPDDLGWTRFGVRVHDFDAVMLRLGAVGVEVAPVLGLPGERRTCFVEPGSASIVELLEANASAPGPGPTLVYASASVSDLELARDFFGAALALDEVAPDSLAFPGREAMWGLASSQYETAVFAAGDVLLELVHHFDPAGRPPDPRALLSDQGIMNVALGYRDHADLLAALAALGKRGVEATTRPPPVAGGVYLRVVDGLSLELLLVPPHLDEAYGFVAQDLSPPGTAFDPAVSAELAAPPT